MFRAINAAMAALFVFGAAVQYNDPDPLRWMSMYLAAAVVALMAAVRSRSSVTAPLLPGIVALVWAVVTASEGPPLDLYARMFEAWEMRSSEVEEAREASGLLIIAFWMAVVAAHAWKQRCSPAAVRSQR